MTKRQTPPGRKSKLDVVVVNPFGPHHCAKCRASVHTENTSSRGASNSRMPMMERGSLSRSRLFLAAMFRILCLRGFGLELLQVGVQAIEALVEKAAVKSEPLVDLLEGARLDPAGPPLRLTAARDQAGTLQHFQVLRHGREAHGERLRQLGHRGLAPRQARQDGATGGIGQRGE